MQKILEKTAGRINGVDLSPTNNTLITILTAQIFECQVRRIPLVYFCQIAILKSYPPDYLTASNQVGKSCCSFFAVSDFCGPLKSQAIIENEITTVDKNIFLLFK